MILGIHHIAINTPNLDRLRDFYCETMGFKFIRERSWENSKIADSVVGLEGSAARVAMIQAGNCFLELFEYHRPAARPAEPLRACDKGYTHLCLAVDDIEAEYNRLVAMGMAFNRSPEGFRTMKAVYAKDPDGNIIELLQIESGHVFSMPKLAEAV